MSAEPSPPRAPSPRQLAAGALGASAAELPRGRRRRELQRMAAALAGQTPPHAEGLAGAWLPLLEAGVAQGDPLRSLPTVLAEAEFDRQLRRRRRWTLVYPCALAAMAVAVLVFLSLAVVPVFDEIYRSFGLQLPVATSVLAAFSRTLRETPERLLAAAGAAAAAVVGVAWLVRRRDGGGLALGRFAAGSSGKVAAAAALARQIADLLAAEAALADAVRRAGQANGNRALRRGASAWAAQAAQADGVPGGPAPRDAALLPATLREILAQAHVAPPARIALLRDLAERYGERLARRLDHEQGLGAPLAVLVLGGLVALAASALFSPLFSLINGLGS